MATSGYFDGNVVGTWRARCKWNLSSDTETAATLEVSANFVTGGSAISGTTEHTWLAVDGVANYWGDAIDCAANSEQFLHSMTKSYAKTHEEQRIAVGASVTLKNVGTSGVGDSTYAIIPAKASYPVTFNANGGGSAPSAQVKWHGETLALSSTKATHADATATLAVTFDANGGTCPTASAKATKTTKYAFSKWNTNSGGTGTSYSPGASYTANAALKLYAIWTSSATTTSVTLPTPTRSGYAFNGWYTATSGGTKAGGAGASYAPTANVTLHAQWTQITYTVSYDANGGSGAPAAQTKKHGAALTLSTTKPTRTGYRFDGWATSASGGVAYAAGGSYAANASVTLYAHWTAAVTLSFDANGGSGAPGAVTGYAGEQVAIPTGAPTRKDYAFQGWAASASNAVAAYQPGGKWSGAASATLYAVWRYTYTKPDITSAKAYRTASSGSSAQDATGECIYASFGWRVTDSNYTAKSVAIRYRQQGASSWTNATVGGTTTGASGTATAGFAASGSKVYDVQATVTDTNSGSASLTVTVGAAMAVMDFQQGGKAVGLLTKAGDAGTIRLGGILDMGSQIRSYAGGGTFNVAHVFGGDQWGHGVSYGGGGATIVGAGESWSTLESVASATVEQLHLGADASVFLHSNCNAIASRKTWQLGTNGTLTAPGDITMSNGNLNMAAGKLVNGAGGIELKPPSKSANHGGYIDFHFNQSSADFTINQSSADFTSRIIEDASGRLTVHGSERLSGGDLTLKSTKYKSNATPSANTSGPNIAFCGSDDVEVGAIQQRANADGSQDILVYARRVVNGLDIYNTLRLGIDANGKRVVSLADPAAWRAALSVEPTKVKSTDASRLTAEANFTVNTFTTNCAGGVCTARVEITTANALTANTNYKLGTIASGLRPYTTVTAFEGYMAGAGWMTSGGVINYRPNAARAANTKLQFTFTYVLS